MIAFMIYHCILDLIWSFIQTLWTNTEVTMTNFHQIYYHIVISCVDARIGKILKYASLSFVSILLLMLQMVGCFPQR